MVTRQRDPRGQQRVPKECTVPRFSVYVPHEQDLMSQPCRPILLLRCRDGEGVRSPTDHHCTRRPSLPLTPRVRWWVARSRIDFSKPFRAEGVCGLLADGNQFRDAIGGTSVYR